MRPGTAWGQLNIQLTRTPDDEAALVAHLHELLTRMESDGTLAAWFFIRKNSWWRLRFRPNDGHHMAAVKATITAALLDLRGRIREWIEVIYEPEVAAFGGPDGIRVAHQLFHQDSRALLAYRAGLVAGLPDHRRELTLLLCTALMRAAGLEWFEQGDVWFRVRQHRPGPVPEPAPQQLTTMRRFLSTDTTADSSLSVGNLAHAAHWLAAFRSAGHQLGELARCGALRRGLRSVISYHILFHWNRLGLPARDQELLADTACTAILGGPRDDPTASPSPQLPTT